MTRINCVPPASLHQKHLWAEYRELPRVFALVAAAIERGEVPTDPRNPWEYTLGTGHVRFFYYRLRYCEKRFQALVRELLARGFTPTHTGIPAIASTIPKQWWGGWTPTPAAIELNLARIRDRMPKD